MFMMIQTIIQVCTTPIQPRIRSAAFAIQLLVNSVATPIQTPRNLLMPMRVSHG
jgi:hypothetical protein